MAKQKSDSPRQVSRSFRTVTDVFMAGEGLPFADILSFTSTCQFVLASWLQLSDGLVDRSLLEDYLRLMLEQIAACEVSMK